MSLVLNEDEYFSMEANVTTPGYQTVALSGYLVERRADGTYIAPLIPQLFYGADGTQLQSWRQDISTAGSQVILSRSGGQPSVPREELYWRKVSEDHVEKEEVKAEQPTQVMAIPSWVIPVAILGVIVGGFIIYRLAK